MHLEPGTVIGGKYQLGRKLATGGQGSVWMARHMQLGSQVAIKFMDPLLASSKVAHARFQQEAKATAQIRHANIVHVQDYGMAEDLPYLVMELFEGQDLAKRLKNEKRLSLQTTAYILNQVARGLRRLHEANFVHRDLKPGNIFLAKGDDGEEIAKILDFGIMKATEAPLGDGTKTGEFIGSPQYMSPEQIMNAKKIDARSDLWSLAVVVFRAITGGFPFQGEALGLVISEIMSGHIQTATSIAPDLPPEVDAFFQRALAHDPAQRFQTVVEMAEAFSRVAGVRAPLPSVGLSELAASWGQSSPPEAARNSDAHAHEASLVQEATTIPRMRSPAASAPNAAPASASAAPPAPTDARNSYEQGRAQPYGINQSPQATPLPAPPGRHSSDPMFNGVPASSSFPPPPSQFQRRYDPMTGRELPSPSAGQESARGPRSGNSSGEVPLSQLMATQPMTPELVQQVMRAGYKATQPLPKAQPTAPLPQSQQANAGEGGPSSAHPPGVGDETVVGQRLQDDEPRRSKAPWVAGGLLIGVGAGVIIALVVVLAQQASNSRSIPSSPSAPASTTAPPALGSTTPPRPAPAPP